VSATALTASGCRYLVCWFAGGQYEKIRYNATHLDLVQVRGEVKTLLTWPFSLRRMTVLQLGLAMGGG